jgi:hypothetical protein
MPPKQEPAIAGEWECMECGFIEKGVEARRPLQCRECGASARALEFFPQDDWTEGAEDDTDDLENEDDEEIER